MRRDESFEEFTADNNSLPWNKALLENLDDIEPTERQLVSIVKAQVMIMIMYVVI